MIRAHIMSWGYQKAPMNMSNCSASEVMPKVTQCGLQVLLLLNVFFDWETFIRESYDLPYLPDNTIKPKILCCYFYKELPAF